MHRDAPARRCGGDALSLARFAELIKPKPVIVRMAAQAIHRLAPVKP